MNDLSRRCFIAGLLSTVGLARLGPSSLVTPLATIDRRMFSSGVWWRPGEILDVIPEDAHWESSVIQVWEQVSLNPQSFSCLRPLLF